MRQLLCRNLEQVFHSQLLHAQMMFCLIVVCISDLWKKAISNTVVFNCIVSMCVIAVQYTYISISQVANYALLDCFKICADYVNVFVFVLTTVICFYAEEIFIARFSNIQSHYVTVTLSVFEMCSIGNLICQFLLNSML